MHSQQYKNRSGSVIKDVLKLTSHLSPDWLPVSRPYSDENEHSTSGIVYGHSSVINEPAKNLYSNMIIRKPFEPKLNPNLHHPSQCSIQCVTSLHGKHSLTICAIEMFSSQAVASGWCGWSNHILQYIGRVPSVLKQFKMEDGCGLLLSPSIRESLFTFW